jgi:hypothetical protein
VIIKPTKRASETNNHLLEGLHGRPRRWKNNIRIDFREASL